MWYLFWAHVICWLGLFIYVYTLVRMSGNLRREMNVLRKAASERTDDKSGWLREGVN